MSVKSHKEETSGSESPDYKLPLYRKLLLTAAFTGNDVCVAFEQLYEVSLLQILGVPVTFVSVYPLVTGPCAMVLINLLGHFSDQGPDHRHRKMAVLVCNCVSMVLGISVLIVANLTFLFSLDAGIDKDNTSTRGKISYLPTNNTYLKKLDSNGSVHITSVLPEEIANLPYVNDFYSEGNNTASSSNVDLVSLPLTAVLGVVGFCLLSIGYDVNTAVTRSCVLACSPSSDHTSILVLALVMAALGGCVSNAIGLVDLPGLLGIVAGDKQAVQTTVLLAVCCLVLVVCVSCTVVTAHLIIQQLGHGDHTSLHHTRPHGETRAYGTFHPTENRHDHAEDRTEGTPDNTTDVRDGIGETTLNTDKGSAETTGSELPGEDSSAACSKRSLAPQHEDNSGESSSCHSSCSSLKDLGTEGSRCTFWRFLCDRMDKNKVNFIVNCVSLYLGTSVVYSYNMYAADFLGKEVMGGDSTAAKGSAELEAYEEGVGTAAGGLLVFVCCYLVISSVHSKLIKFWGLKVDFCLAHVLMATAILTLTLSKHVAVYYVANVCYGFQRSALLSVPFIVASDYIDNQEKRMDRSMVGKMMGIMTCMIPLNYCSLYLMSGPLITLTQYDGAPLLLASVSSCLAALVFLLYRP